MKVPSNIQRLLPTNIRYCTYPFCSRSIRKLNSGIWKRYYTCKHCSYKIRKCVRKSLLPRNTIYFEIAESQIHTCGPPIVEFVYSSDEKIDSEGNTSPSTD